MGGEEILAETDGRTIKSTYAQPTTMWSPSERRRRRRHPRWVAEICLVNFGNKDKIAIKR